MNKKHVLITAFVAAIINYGFYIFGWHNGASLGVKRTLDTVNTLLIKQIESDTSVTKLIMINPDTNTYYLSRKTILGHE